jgi:hypothetical protein
MDKPLRDWTLGEVQANCAASDDCSECDFGKKRGGKCELCRATPGDWDLTALPRFTEQEVADAKELMRMFPRYDRLERKCQNDLCLCHATVSVYVRLDPSLFPHIAIGEVIALSEIAGCGDAR